MKIALYSTMVIPTNPDLEQYGGLELIHGLLAKYYSEKGHQVSLFGCEGSYQSDNCKLFIAGKPGTPPQQAWDAYWNHAEAKQALKDADIVHDASWGYYPYKVQNELKNICHTQHGPDPGWTAAPPFPLKNLIGVSHNHAKKLTEMTNGQHIFRGVQNGIDLSRYPFKQEKGDYFFWLSRIYAFKGTHRFIELCNKAQVKGKIAGGSFGDVKEYVDLIKKMVAESQYVESVGQIGTDAVSADGQVGVGINHSQKVELYQGARAVIIPSIERMPLVNQPNQAIQFIEPFGLITAEANACGTPIITIPSGGWQETMIHGFNGFVANTDDEFLYYMKRVGEIKPENCRKMAEQFSYQRMGEEYLKLYDEIINGRVW